MPDKNAAQTIEAATVAAPIREGGGHQSISPPPTRGAIRTEISTSTDLLVAGQPFSLFVTVYNPFEVPLTLHRISTYLPTEFVDVEKEPPPSDSAGFLERVNLRLAAFFGPMSSRTTGTGDGYVVIARGTGTGTGDGRVVTAQGTGTGDGGSAGTPEEGDDRPPLIRDTSLQEATYSITLQPGNSTTCIFTLRSRRKMWFTPSTYKLSFDVVYGIKDGPQNSDTIQRTLQVRASLVSIAVGAAAGAFVGWVVRRIGEGEGFAWGASAFQRFFVNLFSLFATLLLAMMSVLFIARKKDTQPVVSVEDIWGGVVVGFLVAYSGQNIVGPPSQ